MRILILDDCEALRNTVADILRALGHTVDSMSDAAKAVEMVGQSPYDFVLVDYMMPVNNGIWFMKNAKLGRNTRVILMTAYVNNEVISEMFRLGAVGYLIKPFDSKELLRHLDFHAGGQAAPAQKA